ncbi:MAG: hypothetical protein NXI22_11745 [bacterium]|nr:hypothetical protein [bacterium]
MSRTILNFWLDTFMLLLFLGALWCVFVIRFIFPPASAAAGWTLWGWSYDQWSDLQFGILVAFAFTVLLHLMLHWSWVCGVVTTRLLRRSKKRPLSEGEQTLVGVGLLALVIHVLGIAFFVAMLAVQSPNAG